MAVQFNLNNYRMEKKLLIVVGLMITLNIFWGFLVSIQLPFFPIEVRN